VTAFLVRARIGAVHPAQARPHQRRHPDDSAAGLLPLTFYRDNCADRALTIDDGAGAGRRSRVVFAPEPA
jgi:hypothetical protein